jgi:group I intron endonuclease
MYLVYCLTFSNNKKYIGITSNFNRRMSQHKHAANRNFKSKLYYAVNKYGWENIHKEIISSNLTKLEAMELEKKFILEFDSVNSGYNLTPGGEMVTEHCRQEMIKRMSDPEYRKKCVAALHSNEAQRIAKLKSSENRLLNSLNGKKQLAEGKCKLPLIGKIVRCIETSQIFKSISEAAKYFNGRREHLRDHLKGVKYRKKFKGLHFELVESK